MSANFADAVELSEHLANILQSHLGEWEDGSPRIHIVPPEPKLKGKPKADTASQSELECIIFRVAEGEPRSMSGGQKYREPVYQIELVNYLNDTKLSHAMTVIDADARLISARPRSYLPASTQTYEQCRYYVRTAQVINSVVYVPT
ncbi:hypothetical protein Lepto7375DRAFT_7350 [Leptolyngbya sp. PCC 7375]|nr:hypothetical protein Lepto7375DRAFT_7350 [Leptolyngbya sp. PCC 7375]